MANIAAEGSRKGAVAGSGLVWLTLIISVIPWRQGDYYSGGLDPVVIAKGMLQIMALAWAVSFMPRIGERYPVKGLTLMLFGAFVSISVIGALAVGDLTASVILAVRLFLLALTIVVLVRVFSAKELLTSIVLAMSVVGVGSALTGLGQFGVTGRLGSTIPPLSPNAISMLVGLPALAFFHEIVHGRSTRWLVAGFFVVTGMLFATGSRTALISFCISIAIILLHVRRLPRSVAASFILLIPIGFAVAAYSSIFGQVLVRTTGGSNATLNSRTIAWGAVLGTPVETWQRWLGSGLSVKTVPVTGQYWPDQVLDSSWISALAQSGVVGTIILAIMCLLCIRSSLRANQLRSFTTAALVFVLIRSGLENGLTESSPAFMVFFLISLLVEQSRLGGEMSFSPPSRDSTRMGSMSEFVHQVGFDSSAGHFRKVPRWRTPVV